MSEEKDTETLNEAQPSQTDPSSFQRHCLGIYLDLRVVVKLFSCCDVQQSHRPVESWQSLQSVNTD